VVQVIGSEFKHQYLKKKKKKRRRRQGHKLNLASVSVTEAQNSVTMPL
jgi:ribosomal protein L21